jgi:hypothetical protein
MRTILAFVIAISLTSCTARKGIVLQDAPAPRRA